MADFSLYIGNDTLASLSGLRAATAAEGTYINDGTVTLTLMDVDGVELAGETWPLTMSYITDSDGVYRAVIQDTLSLTPGATYIAELTADGDSLQAQWTVELKATIRGAGD